MQIIMSSARGIGFPPVFLIRLEENCPRGSPEASGLGNQILCTMRDSGSTAVGEFFVGRSAGVGMGLYGEEWGRAMFSVRSWVAFRQEASCIASLRSG